MLLENIILSVFMVRKNFFFVLLPLEKAKELTVEVKDIAHSLTESDAGCSLGVRDQRILLLHCRILQLMSGSL